jgi:hypothetical protein
MKVIKSKYKVVSPKKVINIANKDPDYVNTKFPKSKVMQCCSFYILVLLLVIKLSSKTGKDVH